MARIFRNAGFAQQGPRQYQGTESEAEGSLGGCDDLRDPAVRGYISDIGLRTSREGVCGYSVDHG